ncbi:DNA ligase D [Pelagicoccus sp. SDUM812005]|uniref:DNA ligase D n=1 Tax=Pelagicoccus sp. SDUM812005 TaxID=3041257 RepID=UPI00280DAFD9|nr:DNA ligase D [Pelagicoccus sp. SDUM812005]MDQ8183287.1 DNA ligase D [Pelagicoccus sp. SDUM812005]
MSLAEYSRKRDFEKTPEPPDEKAAAREASANAAEFVIQKHAARRLHYDFRLEHAGALLSWAVPKGPSIDPRDKRLAVRVENHPLTYATFEGNIPAGQYGGGTVLVWDKGYWVPQGEVEEGLRKGKLTFELHGEKLKGRWHLNRMGGERSKENWLLVKAKDSAAGKHNERFVEDQSKSVLTGRELSEIANETAADRKQFAAKPKSDSYASFFSRAIEPQIASLAKSPPEGAEWIHEIKYDGYRILAYALDKRVSLKSRSGKNWTDKFLPIADALKSLSLQACVLDGELIAIGEDGVSSFSLLQSFIHQRDRSDYQLRYMVFDLLFHNGKDLRDLPLTERRSQLRKLLSNSPPGSPIRYSDNIQGNGAAVFKQACQMGLEGIMSKRSSSPYLPGRSRSWLKIKCHCRQEFLVVGYTRAAGSDRGFGALHLASYAEDGQTLLYVGKVGTGFDEGTQDLLRKRLDLLATKNSPLNPPPRGSRNTIWAKPKIVVEIKYAERTPAGLLRQASFVGIREDKAPKTIRDEAAATPESSPRLPKAEAKAAAKPLPTMTQSPAKGDSNTEVAGITITHPSRILYPSIGATKMQVARYYEAVANWMLPYVKNRPLSLLRHPRGRQEKGFFQKHIDSSFPTAIRQVTIEASKGSSTYGYITNEEGLIALLQMGSLEIHTWGSTVDAVEKPNILVFDLDPAENLPSETTTGAALLLRDILADRAGLKSFLKTTGGKGLHVVLPFRRGPTWKEVKQFSKSVSIFLRQQNPNAFTLRSSIKERRGKIYIDYQRNSRGATAIVPYSTRARENATVAMPLSWEEATESLQSNRYTIENAWDRLSSLEVDPWSDFKSTRQSLSKSVLAAFTADPAQADR